MGHTHQTQINSQRLKEDLESKEKRGGGREEKIGGAKWRISEFCTLFCFDLVELRLGFC